MVAPKFLHDKMDELFDDSNFILLAGGTTLPNGNAKIRVISPSDAPIFFACVASELANNGARSDHCPTQLAAILMDAARIIDNSLSGKKDGDPRH
jgi:hypothetical protein